MTYCLPSILLRFRLLVRNSFLFLYDTNFATIGRGFSLFLLFCPIRSLCITLGWIDFILKSISSIINIIIIIFIFFYTIKMKNIFLCTVLVYRVEREVSLFSEPSNSEAVLLFFLSSQVLCQSIPNARPPISSEGGPICSDLQRSSGCTDSFTSLLLDSHFVR